MKCTFCDKDADDLAKQLIKRRDGAEQVFCSQACRSDYESDAEEFYRSHKR
jgi:ribosomal protein L24E